MKTRDELPFGCFVAWFLGVAVLCAAWVAVVIWLVISLIDWLGRH